jgi:hypothetical protein
MAGTPQPFEAKTLSGISCVLEGVEYAEAVASVRFTPAQTVNTWKGGTPDAVFSSMTKPVYSCAMKIGQDYDDAASFTNYLMEHAGESVAATFIFNSGSTIAATLLLAAPEIGGDIDAIMDTTITHGVKGVPVITPPPAG